MKINEFFSKISLNQKLALFALALGFFAFVIGNPNSNTFVKINEQDLSVIVEKGVDHISVQELSDWIIKGKSDYRLIDLRTEKEFSEYSIPTSENIQIVNLTDGDLQRNQKLILYSDGGIHSAQAWFLLKAKGFVSVYMLKGGLDEWKDKILFPKLSADANEQQKSEFEKMAEVSKYFGGSPQTGTTESTVTNVPALPKLQLPAATSAGGAKRKKREGC